MFRGRLPHLITCIPSRPPAWQCLWTVTVSENAQCSIIDSGVLNHNVKWCRCDLWVTFSSSAIINDFLQGKCAFQGFAGTMKGTARGIASTIEGETVTSSPLWPASQSQNGYSFTPSTLQLSTTLWQSFAFNAIQFCMLSHFIVIHSQREKMCDWKVTKVWLKWLKKMLRSCSRDCRVWSLMSWSISIPFNLKEGSKHSDCIHRKKEKH